MSEDGPLREEDELLAAELALGLLDDDDRRSAIARLDRDPAFADAHARWQDYAAAMLSGAGEAPRPSTWSAIEARLPANDVAPPVAARATLRWWQAGTLAASAAALVLGLVAVQRPSTVLVKVPVARQASPPMVAVLTGKTGLVTVSYDPATGHMISAANGLDVGDHSPELWVIPADGKPRPIGVMDSVTPRWTIVPGVASSVFAAGVTIAVSVEPVGGSPTGQPTGPVILTGKMVST